MDALSRPDLELSFECADELKRFLERLPRHIRRGRFEEARAPCTQLLDRVKGCNAATACERAWLQVRERLQELQRALEEKPAKAYLLARYEELGRAYEAWLAARKEASPQARQAARELGALKPLIGARTIFHMASGLTGFVCYQFLLTKWQSLAVLLAILGLFLLLEVTRRMSRRWNRLLHHRAILGAIARPYEYKRVPSATLYVLALCLVLPVFSRPAVLSGCLILAFADPAAAWLGSRYGRLKLHRSKSLVGSLAFLATGTLVAAVFLLTLYPELSLARRLAAAFVASLAGAVAELFSNRIDDNLSVPIAATLAAALFI